MLTPDQEDDDDQFAGLGFPADLELGPAPGKWRVRSQCRESDPKDFYPGDHYERGTPEYRKAKQRAKATCNICPVRELCREFAVENDIRSGIWGGLTEPERRRLRAVRRAARGS